MSFFDSYIGMYVVQSIAHSVITLLIVEMSLRIWTVGDARERFRYRLLVLILPFVLFPFFQFINPERGSFYFIEDTALFSSLRWLKIEILGKRPFTYLFLLVVGLVSGVVLIQEIVPIIKDIFSRTKEESTEGRPAGPEIDSLVGDISRAMKATKPSVYLIDDDSPIIYTTGTKNHSIVMSVALLTAFSMRELKSALAHEIAHILRRSNITTLLVFIVRICMFYNPISLLEFRKLVQDDEHICDDITVSVTGDPAALASALGVFCLDVSHSEKVRLADVRQAIESSSHNLLLHERIERLENNTSFGYHAYGWGRYAVTLAAIIGVSYFVV